MTLDKLLTMASENGFTQVAPLDVATIELRPEVRQMCQDNKCKLYDTNWACPPGCGSLLECQKKIALYKKGIILQTTGTLEDSFDLDGMVAVKEKHNKNFDGLVDELYNAQIKMLPLGDGCCRLCEECTYPDELCRFPERAFSSMEAFGILVSDLCQANDMKYYYGPNTLTYVGCILFDPLN